MITIQTLSENGARHFGDRVALVFEGRSTTYRELDQAANRLARFILQSGVAQGERIAILSDNCDTYVTLYLAAVKAGAVAVPINMRLSDTEIVAVLQDCAPKLYFCGDGYHQKAATHALEVESILDVIDRADAGFAGRMASYDSTAPATEVGPGDLAVIMYTGGTTGRPKGVMLSHGNIMTAAISAALHTGMSRDDTTCFVLPIFHVAWWPLLAVLLVGGKAVIIRTPDIDGIMKLVEEHRCTHINMVPTLYGWLCDHPRGADYDLSSLRSLSYAGSPFPVEVLKRCIRKFGNIFAQGYGATETAGAPISFFVAEDHDIDDEARLKSAGKPAICSQVKICDEQFEQLPVGELGEICVKGPHVMMGYWNQPDLTKAALRDGWYRTGDVGYVDADGYVYLTDRKSDMIITGGENVYPKEVEDILYRHASVVEASVFGLDNQNWGQVVTAAVVVKTDAAFDPDEIINFCRPHLAGYKVPKQVVCLPALPKTAIGKIDRKEIRRMLHDRIS